jgi:tetratricopeptide (TPR) repeat protein
MEKVTSNIDTAVREAAELAEQARWEEAIALLKRLLRNANDSEVRSRLQLALVRVYNEEDWTRGLRNHDVKHALLDDVDRQSNLPKSMVAEASYLRGAVLHVDFIMGEGDPERELACLTRAAELFSQLGDRENAALATSFIGIFHHVDRLDREAAEPILRRAYEMAPSTGGSYAKAEAARHLGQIQQERGDSRGALGLLEEALELVAEARLTRHLSSALHAVGFAHLEAGDLDVAEDYLQRAREMGERLGGRFFLGLIARTEADLAFMRQTSSSVHRRTHP